MSTELAIVDDRDPTIAYGGSWSDGGVAQEFQSTTHWASAAGSTARFSFTGTSVAVYGTVASGSTQASMSFSVDDGLSTGSYTRPSGLTAYIHHELLFASPTLDDAEHTLVITQTLAQAHGVIYFDFLTYSTTSPPASAGAGTSLFVDDQDARITYQPKWISAGGDGDFMHTAQISPGAGAQLSLNFTGRGIALYGDLTPGIQVNVSITLDSGAPVFFVRSLATGLSLTNNLIYQSGDLANGTHTLVARVENNNSIAVDYLLVVPPLPEPGSSTILPPSNSSTDTTLSSSVQSTSTATPTTPVSKHSHNHTNRLIIGACAGLLGFILLLATLLCCVHRRRRRRGSTNSVPTTSVVVPFIATSQSMIPLLSPPYLDSPSHHTSMSSSPSGSPLTINFPGKQHPWRASSRHASELYHSSSGSSLASAFSWGGSPIRSKLSMGSLVVDPQLQSQSPAQPNPTSPAIGSPLRSVVAIADPTPHLEGPEPEDEQPPAYVEQGT